MFRKWNWVWIGLVVIVVVLLLRSSGVEGLANRDASKNLDVPELQSTPELTPEGAELKTLKNRVDALESAVQTLRSGK